MLRAKSRFNKGIERIRKLDTVYLHLVTSIGIPHSDVADILRSQIMYLVSAFDKFIHDLVRQGMVDAFLNTRIKTASFKKFSISLEQFHDLTSSSIIPPAQTVFENIVIQNHRHLSFQTPEKVVQALSLVWDEPHKWQKISSSMGLPENDVRVELNNIVIRRNQIVHENDFDLLTNTLQPITHDDVKDSVDFIEKLGGCIYSEVVLLE